MKLYKLITDLFQYVLLIFLIMILLDNISNKLLLFNLRLFLLINVLIGVVVFILNQHNDVPPKRNIKKIIPYRMNILFSSILTFVVLIIVFVLALGIFWKLPVAPVA